MGYRITAGPLVGVEILFDVTSKIVKATLSLVHVFFELADLLDGFFDHDRKLFWSEDQERDQHDNGYFKKTKSEHLVSLERKVCLK